MAEPNEIELSASGGGDAPAEEIAETSFTLPDVAVDEVDPSYDNLAHLRKGLDLVPTVDQYYADLQKMYNYERPERIDYNKFKIAKENEKAKENSLYHLTPGGAWVRVTSISGGRPMKIENFNKYHKIVSSLGVRPILLPPETVAKLQKTLDDLPIGNIENQDIAQTASNVINSVERLISDAELEKALHARGLNLRELEGLDKTMQTFRGELVNNLAKLTELDKKIVHQKQKVAEANDLDVSIRTREEQILEKLEDERTARLEATSDIRNFIRVKLNRLREIISMMLNKNISLGTRIRTLFREQGITIASILTALSMTIAFLVQVLTGSKTVTGSTPNPDPPKPPEPSGIRDWTKQRLQDLGRLLGKLAEKAAAALPGIIGNIVSWLLSTAQKAVSWLSEHLWALVVAAGGMLYLTVRDYMTVKLATSRGPPKND